MYQDIEIKITSCICHENQKVIEENVISLGLLKNRKIIQKFSFHWESNPQV